MKKVLLATTMLVAGASIAAAEGGVTLSGDARMGIISDFGDAGMGFTSRARVSFSLAGESDSGLSFGASFRADNAGGAAGGTAGSVFVSGAFGKLTMGDVDSAAQSAVGQVAGVGLTGLGDINEITYIGAGGFDTDELLGTSLPGVTSDPTALYEYSAGAFTAYASVTQPNYEFSTTAPAGDFTGDAYAIGAKYSTDAYTFSLGYEKLSVDQIAPAVASAADLDHIVAGASGTFSGVTVKAVYGKGSGTVDTDTVDLRQYALSATYTMDALSVTAFHSRASLDLAGVTDADASGLGLGVSYDLGGGAAVKAGVARAKDNLTGVADTAYDLGVSFSF